MRKKKSQSKLLWLGIALLWLLAIVVYASHAHATVQTTYLTSGPYNTNGTTTVFNTTFTYISDGDLVVYLTNTTTGTITTLVQNSDYSVQDGTPTADDNVIPGGTITILANAASGIANSSGQFPSGYTITITRNMTLTQLQQYPPNGVFPATNTELAFDRAVLVDQQQQAILNKAITAPLTDPSGLNYTLPSAVARASQYVGFDASGNVTALPSTAAPTSLVTATGTTTPLTIATQFGNQFYLSQFGAKCDGSTDDTAAIASAMSACSSSGGGKLNFQGTCVASQINMLSYCAIDGGSMSTSELKQKSGTNTDFIISNNFATLTGTNAYYPNNMNVPVWYGLGNLRINSNNNTSGRMIAWYGSGITMFGKVHVWCDGSNTSDCVYTEGPAAGSVGTSWQADEEAFFDTVIIEDSGGVSWHYRGPKDCYLNNYLGVLTNGGSWGWFNEANGYTAYSGTCDYIGNLHVYSYSGGTNRLGAKINALLNHVSVLYLDGTTGILGGGNDTFNSSFDDVLVENGGYESGSTIPFQVTTDYINIKNLIGVTDPTASGVPAIVKWTGAHGYLGASQFYDSSSTTNVGLWVSGTYGNFNFNANHFPNSGSFCVENTGYYNNFSGTTQNCATHFQYAGGTNTTLKLKADVAAGQVVIGSQTPSSSDNFQVEPFDTGAAAGGGYLTMHPGSATVPSIPVGGDMGTGWFAPVTHGMSLAANGNEIVRMQQNGGSSNIQVINPTGFAGMLAIGSAGYGKYFSMYTGNTERWDFGSSSAAESGSNVGSDFTIDNYNDAGTYITTPVTIKRSTGFVGIGTSVPSTALHVNGTLTVGNIGSTLGQIVMDGSSTGSATINAQATQGSPVLTLPNTTGTFVTTASAPLSINATTGAASITGVAGQVLAGATPAFTATPTLGASGTLGSITLGNATSGLVTLSPVTGALGTVTASLPANTGTIAETNLAQTFTAVQTITNSDILLLGSSTGATTFTSANASGTNYTLTFPAITDTIVTLTATQTLTSKTLTSPTLTTPALGVATATSINALVLGTYQDTTSVGVGASSLTSSSTTALQNTSVGYQAGAGVTTQTQNTFMGYQAGNGQTVTGSGGSNVAIGWSAASQGNSFNTVAVGVFADKFPESNDVAIGDYAILYGSGGNNVVVGYSAGSANGSNSYSASTVLGYSVGSSQVMTGSHDILLGTSSTCALSGASASGEFHLCGSTTDSMKITGMGTQATEAVTIYGTITLPNVASSASALNYMCYNSGTGLTTYDSSGTCLASLEELKDIIAPITSIEAIAEVEKLKPFWGKYKDSETGIADHRIHAMFGAHQVESVDPRLTSYDGEGKLHGVRYMEMTALLTAAIQEQEMTIKNQQEEIDGLLHMKGLPPRHCNMLCRYREWIESVGE